MEQLTPERMAQIKNILKEMDINPANQSLIQDNKLIFSFENKSYRCKMPNQREQAEAEQYQNKYKIKLVQEDGTITRKKLIKILKEKQDVDIVELEKEKEKTRLALQDIYISGASLLSDETQKLKEWREKKNKIEEQFMEITIEIMELLSPCIEEQTKIQYYKYLAYLCTERQIAENNFEKIWQTYLDFEKDDTGLTYKAIEYLQSLLLNIKE